MNDPKFSCYMVICNFAGGILHGGCTLVAKTRYPAFIFKSAFCLATFTPIHKANHKHKPLVDSYSHFMAKIRHYGGICKWRDLQGYG